MRIGVFHFLFCILLLYLNGFSALSQVKKTGIPVIQNFSKEDYSAGTQNWAIVQDERGILYFANNNGLLEFDGTFWRTYPMPNSSVVRSVSIAKDKKIYIGAYNECGFFSPDEKGVLKYHSLMKYLEKPFDIGEVWKIYESKEGIFFQSFNCILLWNGKVLTPIYKDVSLMFSFLVNGNYYVQVRGKGLFQYKQKRFEFLEGTASLSNEEIWTILELSGGKLLIGTFNYGLFSFDGHILSALTNEASNFLKQNQIFSGIKLENGLFAVGSIQNGVIIFNEEGTILQQIDRQKGLQNNTVLSIFFDANKNLWLGLDNGIDYIEVNSPVSYLIKKKELGAGYAAILFNGYIYLGTNQGLFRQKWPENDGTIEKIPETQGQVWSLFHDGTSLLCAHDKGVFEITDKKAVRLNSQGTWKFFKLPGVENFMFSGTYGGISVYEKVKGAWKFRNRIKGFQYSSRLFALDQSNNIWISHGSKGVFRVQLQSDYDSVSKCDFYATKDGLPVNYGINIAKIEDRVLFCTSKGLYQFHEANKRFEIAEDLFNVFQNQSVSNIFKGSDNYYWFISKAEPGIFLKHLDGSYSLENTSLRKISGAFINSFENILQLDAGNVIMAVEDGFVHFDPQFKTNNAKIPKCFIRSVLNTGDSVLYGGNDSVFTNSISDFKKLKFENNSLKFSFISPEFTDGGKTLFRYKLENFDKDWSDWNKQYTKEYTNLPEGNYEFKVIAKNIFGIESEAASYKFEILPPFYRSWLAYLIYIILVSGSFLLIYNISRRKYEREKSILKEKQKRILEEKEQSHSREVLNSQQEIVKLRNEMLELENERSKTEVELKKKELASLATQMTRKNEILEKIKFQLSRLSDSIKPEEKRKLNAIIKSIDQDIHIDEDWEKFEKYFDQVHGDFIKRLRERFPNLTPTDLKLCAYLKMNISSKEIAPLLNISVRSVEVSRYRLRKKLNLHPEDNLVDIMLDI